jgi:hypothetical protein
MNNNQNSMIERILIKEAGRKVNHIQIFAKLLSGKNKVNTKLDYFIWK